MAQHMAFEVFEISQQIFEEWGQKLPATILAVMPTSIDRPYPKMITKE